MTIHEAPTPRLRKCRPRYLPNTNPNNYIRAIELILKESYGMDINFLRQDTRKREIVYIRYAIAAILRKYTTMTLDGIGRYVGKDPATVRHAEKQCNYAKQGFNQHLLSDYNNFKDNLKKMGAI